MNEELPRKTEKPWGHELLYAHTEKYAGKLIFVKKGHRLSLQYHQRKDESMYILSGKARIDSGEDETKLTSRVLEPGGIIRLKPLTRHRVEALEDTTLLEVSTPELEDVVRLQDDYGRAEKP